MYAFIENGSITRTTNNLRKEFPNTSFPATLPDAHEGWVKVAEGTKGDFDTFDSVQLVDGVPTKTYVRNDDLVTAALNVYAKSREQESLTVSGFTENFTEEHRRNLKEAVDLLREINSPDTTEIMWRGTIAVTLATAVAWLVAGGQKRQKRFVTEASLDTSNINTQAELETAFDAAYDNA